MNFDRASILSFAPADPGAYWATFTGEKETWTLPVLGFATLVTYAAKEEGDRSDSRLTPVILDEDGHPVPVMEYLTNWEPRHQPKWRVHLKGTPEATCPAGCGKATVYDAALDRHVHADGSYNQTCWRRITRGEV